MIVEEIFMKIWKKVLCAVIVVVLCLTSAPLGGFVGLELPWFDGKANAVNCQAFFDQNIVNPATQAILVFNLNGSTLKIGDYVYEPTIGQLVYKGGEEISDPFIKIPRDSTMQNVGQYVQLPAVYSPEGYLFNGWYCYVDGITYPANTNYKIPDGAAGTAIEFIAAYLPADPIYTYRVENNEAIIVDVDESISGNVVIPSTLSGYPVVAIDKYAFANKLNIESINIPDTVTQIGKYAFSYCMHLKHLNLPENLNDLGEAAFRACRSLESITIPESVEEIKDYAFYYCMSLKEVKILDTISSIGRRAFSYCGLSDIEVPESVLTIGNEAFRGCLDLENVYINNQDVILGEKAVGYTDICLRENITAEQLLSWMNEDYCDTDEYNYTNGDVLLWTYDDLFEDVYQDVRTEYLSKYVQAFDEDQKMNDILIHCFRESTAKEYAVANDFDYSCFDHSYTESSITEATCTDEGFTTYTCECGDTYNSDYTDKLDHNYASEITTPTTHLKEGVITYTCECGDSYTESIEKITDHTYEKTVTTPTCTAQGFTTYTCECGDTYNSDYTDILEHDFVNWTSNNDGTHTGECSRKNCDHTEINDCIFSAWQVTEYGESRICIDCGHKETRINTDDGDIEIDTPENPEEDFEADEVEPNESNYILVEEAFEENHEGDYEILKAFDINLKNKDGVHVQPNGKVKVKLPLDSEKEGIYKVYRVNDDGTLTDMNAYRQGSHMVFETDHFSLYVIVDESEKPIPENPSDNCSCNCHKNGIAKFFFKFILFFQKLFKANKTCKCGINHY